MYRGANPADPIVTRHDAREQATCPAGHVSRPPNIIDTPTLPGSYFRRLIASLSLFKQTSSRTAFPFGTVSFSELAQNGREGCCNLGQERLPVSAVVSAVPAVLIARHPLAAPRPGCSPYARSCLSASCLRSCLSVMSCRKPPIDV
jgi:hypothetical protein